MTSKPISELEHHEFASALMLMKFRAGQLGFFKTMHALEPATQAIGYEMADKIEAAKKVGALDKAAREAAWNGYRSPSVSSPDRNSK
jgi:hypothetical protein